MRVCQVLPTGVNTSGFLHTRTRGFRFPKRITWLLQDPETVARAVVRCLEQTWVRNIPLGLQGKTTLLVGAFAPRLIDVVSGFIVRLVERGDAWNPRSTTSSMPRFAVTTCAAPAGAPTTIQRLTWTSNPNATEMLLRRWCPPGRGVRPVGLALGVRTLASGLVFATAVALGFISAEHFAALMGDKRTWHEKMVGLS